jgi:hypothetical protein
VLVLVALFDRYAFFFLSFLSKSFFTFCLYMKATSCFLFLVNFFEFIEFTAVQSVLYVF